MADERQEHYRQIDELRTQTDADRERLDQSFQQLQEAYRAKLPPGVGDAMADLADHVRRLHRAIGQLDQVLRGVDDRVRSLERESDATASAPRGAGNPSRRPRGR